MVNKPSYLCAKPSYILKEGLEYTLNPKGDRWVRVFLLDDGSKWTVVQVQEELGVLYDTRFSLPTVRGRLLKHTDPKEIFKPMHYTSKGKRFGKKAKFLLSPKDEEEMELLKLVLRTI